MICPLERICRFMCANLCMLCLSVQPILVELAPGQVQKCLLYELENLLSTANARITTMYEHNPVCMREVCCIEMM